MRRKLSSILLAGVLATLPSIALGASQSSSTSQTLSVQSTLSLTGVPASVAYGTGLGGTTLSGPNNATNVAATSNSPEGLKLSVKYTDLARTAGGGSIVATANQLSVSATPMSSDCGAGGWNSGDPATRNYPGPASTDWLICTRTTAGAINFPGASKTWTMRVVVPAAAVPGDYTGTVTWTAAEH